MHPHAGDERPARLGRGVSRLRRDDHRRLWRHIARLVEAGKPADVVTVSESVEASEDKDKTGGAAYLAALAQNTPSALNIRRYAELVRERSVQRRLAHVATEIAESALAPTGKDVGQLLDDSRRAALVVVAHEDSISWGYGAEIAARIGSELFEYLDAPVKRVGALDTFVGYNPALEDAILPQVGTLAKAMRETARY